MAIENLAQYEGHNLMTQNPTFFRALQLFDRLSNIPHPSNQEEAIREAFKEIGRKEGWEIFQDEVGNLALRLQASPGKEGVTPINFQGHMDMVTRKDDEVDDTMTPRTAVIVDKGQDGDEKGLWMQTKNQDMTLGADNLMAVCLVIEMLRSLDIEHGPINLVLTMNEESGMTGARNLDPSLLLQEGFLVNVDSEDGASDICIASAGQSIINANLPIKSKEALPENHEVLDIQLGGLDDGHSGDVIHLGRGNAIKIMANLLNTIKKDVPDLRLVHFSGGERVNSTPKQAHAKISVPKNVAGRVESLIQSFESELKQGESVEDPSMTSKLLAEKAGNVFITCEREDRTADMMATTNDFRDRLLDVLQNHPNGPFSREDVPNVGNLITLSNNMGQVTMDTDGVQISSMARGAHIEELTPKVAEIKEFLEKKGATVDAQEPTKGWVEDPSSPAVQLVEAAVEEVTGEANFIGYHAALECPIISEIPAKSMPTVSIGFFIPGVHTNLERVDLQSAETAERIFRTIVRIHNEREAIRLVA